MRWSLVCMPPNVTGKVIHAAVSELNQINIIILYYAAILHQTVQVKTVWFSQFYLKFAFSPFFSLLFCSFIKNSWMDLNDKLCKWLWVGALSQGAEERKWPTLIYPGCSLVWLVPSEHLAASHSLPLSLRDHRSPTSFLRGHKYFPQTPCCFHIILQTPPNDSKRQTMHPFSSVLLSVHTHFTLAKKHVPTPW